MSVGFPNTIYLCEFGQEIFRAFGAVAYHVGSSLDQKIWRDVDVRLILDDNEYEQLGLGDPKNPHDNPKWVLLCKAFSELGKARTGLPIDFQIQQKTWANNEFPGQSRGALIRRV